MTMRKNVCQICEGEDWMPLDTVSIKQPDGKKIDFPLRDRDFWYSQSYLYDEPLGFQVCQKCGFLTYAPRWDMSKWSELLGKGRVNENIICARERRARGAANFLFKHNAIPMGYPGFVCDFGCEFGFLKNEILKKYPDINLFYAGFEPNEVIRMYGKSINGITYGDWEKRNFDETLPKIELAVLSYYLQLDPEPRKLLEQIHSALVDDGLLYVDVPLFLESLQDVTGHGALNFEFVYHPNFNNYFTKTSIRNLFKVAGFDIVVSEPSLNGERFLLKKGVSSNENLEKDDPTIVKNLLLRQRQAIELCKKGIDLGQEIKNRDQATKLLLQAVKIFPTYIEGWLYLSTHQEYYRDVNKLKTLFDEAIRYAGRSIRLLLHFAALFKNWGEVATPTTWTKLATDLYNEVLEKDQDNIDALAGLLYIDAFVNQNEQEMNRLVDLLIAISPEKYSSYVNIRCLYYQNRAKLQG